MVISAYYTILISADINECVADSPCDANAVCYNTESSYSCQCGEGYTGNGTHCEGTHIITTSHVVGKIYINKHLPISFTPPYPLAFWKGIYVRKYLRYKLNVRSITSSFNRQDTNEFRIVSHLKYTLHTLLGLCV